MDLKLKGRKALITGGSKGIGAAAASLLAAEGCNLVLVARDPIRLNHTRDEIAKSFNVGIDVVSADIGTPDAAEQLASRYADIDILVNNAGAIPSGSLLDIDDTTWRSSWDLKVFGLINLSREIYRTMRDRRTGVIVNVIGWAGERVDANYIAGSMANAGLIAFSRALGSKSPSDGVRVVAVNPGPVATDRLEVLQRKRAALLLGDAERWRELVEQMPFNRAATAQEIAAAIAFLASPLSGYTSGATLSIDGGLTWAL